MILLQCAITFVSPLSLLAARQLIVSLVGHEWRRGKVEQWRKYEHGEGKAMYRNPEMQKGDG